jgi:hypothetical protein
MNLQDFIKTNASSISTYALVINLFGTIVLTFSISSYMHALSCSVLALEEFKDTYLSGGHIMNFTGLDRIRIKSQKKSKAWTYIGVMMVIASVAAQIMVNIFKS